MNDLHIKHIWHPETGITDTEADWRILCASEIESIQKIWSEQRARLKGTKQLAEFSERLSREWAIETGIIENIYDIDRGVTQTLIERGFQAELLTQGSTNQPRDYVIQLLKDQKAALDGIFDFVSQKRELSTSYIKELHAALLRSQTHTDAIDTLGHNVSVPLTRGDWKHYRTHQRGTASSTGIVRQSKSRRRWIAWWHFISSIVSRKLGQMCRPLGCIIDLPKSILSKTVTDGSHAGWPRLC